MPRMKGFVGPSYASATYSADIEDLINLYLRKEDSPNAYGPLSLASTPGVSLFASVGNAPIRGLFAQSGRAWNVADRIVNEFTAAGVQTNRGTVLRDDHLATLTSTAYGGDQLFVTSGGHKYILDLITGTFTDKGPGVITGTNVIMGDMLDSFFLALEDDGFSISNSNDGLVWDPTQFAQRDSAPDPWVALKVVGTRLYLIGEFTSDVYTNTGASPFPFEAVQGSVIPVGTPAPFSAAAYKGSLCFLGQTRSGARTVQRLTAYTPTKISTAALDSILAGYTRVDDAEGFAYQELGIDFYVLNLPSQNVSWVYDDVGGWHQRGTWNAAQNRYDAWHARCHCLAFDQHLVGDRATDAIYTLSSTLHTDFGGAVLRRVRTAPNLGDVEINNLTLVMDTGVGIPGVSDNPVVALQTSRNKGKTWGTERWRRLGKQGEYQTRVRWNQLGSDRDFAVRTIFTDAAPVRIVDALVNEADGLR
jgi:hypothetical protein